jgi:hypothetical protein
MREHVFPIRRRFIIRAMFQTRGLKPVVHDDSVFARSAKETRRLVFTAWENKSAMKSDIKIKVSSEREFQFRANRSRLRWSHERLKRPAFSILA